MKIMTMFISIFLSFSASADPIKDIGGTKQLCHKSADAFGAGSPKQSIELLKPHWPLPVEEIDNLVYQTESQLKMIPSRFGSILGADFVGTKVAGESFVQHTYIVKFEKHAMRYICVFYKPKKAWIVNTVSWDTQTALLFK